MFIHGLARSATRHLGYTTWTAMMQRCYNPKATSYTYYGGRGITVCKRWHSFENFIADMGQRPYDCSIERKNYNKGYTKSNCKWADSHEQTRNYSKNVNITVNGKTQCMADWATEIGLSKTALFLRLRNLSPEEAITLPNKRLHKDPTCPQGHLMSGDNLKFSKTGGRICVTCSKAHKLKYARTQGVRPKEETLIPENVIWAIRELAVNGLQQNLIAKQFNVSRSLVCSIAKGTYSRFRKMQAAAEGASK